MDPEAWAPPESVPAVGMVLGNKNLQHLYISNVLTQNEAVFQIRRLMAVTMLVVIEFQEYLMKALEMT